MAKTIDGKTLSDLTGLSDRRHRQLAEAGHFPPPTRGKYDLVATLKGLFKYYRTAIVKKADGIDAARLKKLNVEIEILILDRDTKAGLLISTAAALRVFEQTAAVLKRIVLTSKLSKKEKHQFLTELSSVKPADFLEETAEDSGK